MHTELAQGLGRVYRPGMTDVSPQALFALDEQALRCPHVALRQIREESSARWFDDLEAYVVTRFADVMEILHQPVVFSTRHAGGKRAATSSAPPVLLTADPPEHDRQRALVNRAFTPGAVKHLEPQVRELATSLVDRFVDRGRVELIAEYATPLPMTMIAQYMAIPASELDTFKRWSTDLVVMVGNPNPTEQQLSDLATSSREFAEYFRALIAERRGAEGDDLVTKVVNAEIDGDRLSDEEILTMLRQLLLAGNDTTTNLIGSCGLLLAQHPEMYARLRSEPGYMEPFLEEVLRLESPIQGLHRTATVDTRIGDVDIPAGSQILLMHAGANRDPEEFPGPDEFDTTRAQPRGHLAFGYGAHYCLGAALARMEGRVALEVLASRLETLALADDAVVEYEPSFLLRGLGRLDLVFTAA